MSERKIKLFQFSFAEIVLFLLFTFVFGATFCYGIMTIGTMAVVYSILAIGMILFAAMMMA